MQALFSRGRVHQAAALATELTRRCPEDGFGWNALGGALGQMGRFREAAAHLQRAVELMPESASAHSNLGAALIRLDHLSEAEFWLRRALAIDPRHLDAQNNLGIVLRRLGRIDEALRWLDLLIRAAPENPQACNSLGLALHDSGRLEEAAAAFERALQAAPRFAEAHNNLSITLKFLGHFARAEESCRAAITINPSYADAWLNLALALQLRGCHDEAQSCCRRARDLDPDSASAQSGLLFCMSYGGNPAGDYLAEARRYGSIVAARAAKPFSAWRLPPPGSPLRVGFVSGDLREHPVGHFLESVLACIDPSRVELVAYPTTVQHDAVSERLCSHFSSWRPLCGMNDEVAAGAIHADGIQVLVDLSGHTAGNRLPVFAHKPAPVQATWLGFFATTGVAQMDYLIADGWTLPPQDECQFTERVWRLPRTRMCFTAPATEVAPSALPALANGYVTFCCFNNLSKVNDAVLDVWSAILARLPCSRLVLKAPQLQDPAECRRTADRLARAGIDPIRIDLEQPEPRSRYFAAYHRADIALDPFPFTGATTTVESLWMGVPVLSMQGDRLVARQGAGLLQNAGLADWIATDAQDYATLAVRHAGDLNALASLRAALRDCVLASPIFDAPRFARDLEDALVGMWRERSCHPA